MIETSNKLEYTYQYKVNFLHFRAGTTLLTHPVCYYNKRGRAPEIGGAGSCI